MPGSSGRVTAALLIALAVLAPLSLLAGRVWLDPFHPTVPGATVILAELRAPRVLLAIVVGAALGGSGAAMQGYLRNPLADPGVFGVSATAALGAVAAMFAGALAPIMLPLFALIGAAGGMLLLAVLAGRGGTLLFTLAGLMVSSLAGALTALLLSLAPNPFALAQLVEWLMGALTDRTWADLELAAPLVALGLGLLWTCRADLDALTLGEDVALSLGSDPARLRWRLVLGVGLCVGGSVAVAGIIGFVGLMAPHLVRPLTDRRPSSLMLPASLAGALLVLIADTVCRVLPLVQELRLGVALGLIGAPFFLALLMRLRRTVA